MSKNVTVKVKGVQARGEVGSVTATWTQVREYWEKHPLLLLVVVVATLGSPFLGLLFPGWVGVWVGLAISVATFLVGLRAITRVREITRSP
jgi:hypothetical protein